MLPKLRGDYIPSPLLQDGQSSEDDKSLNKLDIAETADIRVRKSMMPTDYHHRQNLDLFTLLSEEDMSRTTAVDQA